MGTLTWSAMAIIFAIGAFRVNTEEELRFCVTLLTIALAAASIHAALDKRR